MGRGLLYGVKGSQRSLKGKVHMLYPHWSVRSHPEQLRRKSVESLLQCPDGVAG